MGTNEPATCFHYSDTVYANPDHTNLYSKYRPTLPSVVVNCVLGKLRQGIDESQWKIAVDVGCGGGQSTRVWAKYFKQVFGFDVSQAQLNEALREDNPSNIHFEVSRAEKMPKIESNSVQLVTACTAAHWFQIKEFFAEVNRILVPNGLVALIGYEMFEPIDPDNPHNEVLQKIMMTERKGPIFQSYELLVDVNRYKNIVVPEQFEYEYVDDVINRIEMKAQDILGYVETMSVYNELLKANPSMAKQYLIDLEKKLKDIIGTNDLKNKKLFFQYRYYIVFGRKK